MAMSGTSRERPREPGPAGISRTTVDEMAKKRTRTRKEGEKQEETPDKFPRTPDMDVEAGSLVGRAALSTLDTASLTRLLAVKNIPGR